MDAYERMQKRKQNVRRSNSDIMDSFRRNNEINATPALNTYKGDMFHLQLLSFCRKFHDAFLISPFLFQPNVILLNRRYQFIYISPLQAELAQ